MSIANTEISIAEWLEGLRELPEDGFAEAAMAYGEEFPIARESLEPYAFFSEERYTRNLIFKNELFEVLSLCWEPGQISTVHNHRNQECWMAVVEGQLENQNYCVTDKDPIHGTCVIHPTSKRRIVPGTPLGVDPEEPVHSIANLAEWSTRAMSIHVYSKPFDTCEVYCPEFGRYQDVTLSYTTMFGQLVDPNSPQDPCR